jgi:hypothetical protein
MWRLEISEVLIFLKMFTVSQNFHVHTTFQFPKTYLRVWYILFFSLDVVTFQMFILPEILILSNSDRIFHVFQNTENNLNFSQLRI